MSEEVKFQHTYGTTFLGRNGTGKSIGLDMFADERNLSVYPITSKGDRARCMIDIPIKDIPAVIDALSTMYKNIKH